MVSEEEEDSAAWRRKARVLCERLTAAHDANDAGVKPWTEPRGPTAAVARKNEKTKATIFILCLKFCSFTALLCYSKLGLGLDYLLLESNERNLRYGSICCLLDANE